MGFSSRKWADIVSNVASRLYFFIIILQVPLFRFPCRIGTCQTPMDIMACQLIVTENFPGVIVKASLYPGAIINSFIERTDIPDPDQLINSYKSNMRETHFASNDLKHLEIIAGSYFCVAGAFLGLMRRGRMGLIGLILILWSIIREMFSGKHASEDICTYHYQMIITMIIAFVSVRRDVRKILRCCKIDCFVGRVKNYLKAKDI